jgi:large subunit ribosomal protein L10
MTKEEKINMINIIKSELDNSANIYVTDCSGLNADSTSKLRRACFKSNVKLSVVKNTLLLKAMEEVEKDFGDLKSVLNGNTALMYSEVGNAPAKVIKNFRKKSEKPILKGAFIEEAIYLGDDMLDSLVEIKSKEELIGEIIGLLQSPAKNLVSALKSSGNKISGVLKTLSEKNENN